MNGFILYGFRLVVKMARYEGRRGGGSNHRKSMGQSNQDKVKIPKSMEVKRIIGHVEVGELWNLRRSLVGETSMVYSTNSIQSRLTEWGLGEIKVQRLGGKSFLLTIIDDELFLMLEDLGWSYLKEIFTNVELWSEKVSSKVTRSTWIEISGVPLYCWNQVTLSRLAELWGSFEALVKVEVGNLSFLVRVEEKGLLDQPTNLLVGVSNLKKASEKIYQVEDSTSSTSLDSSLKSYPIKGGVRQEVEDEINVASMEKCFLTVVCNSSNPQDIEDISDLGLEQPTGAVDGLPKNSDIQFPSVEMGDDQLRASLNAPAERALLIWSSMRKGSVYAELLALKIGLDLFIEAGWVE
ncbi:hypothetical protein V6N13_061738 [Hibiscus sabdariffa]